MTMRVVSPYFKNNISKPGYIYVLVDAVRPGYCKIGRTKQLASRMSAARTFAPSIRCMATFGTDDYVNDEKRIHDILKQYRMQGTEWYACTVPVACKTCLEVIQRCFIMNATIPRTLCDLRIPTLTHISDGNYGCGTMLCNVDRSRDHHERLDMDNDVIMFE